MILMSIGADHSQSGQVTNPVVPPAKPIAARSVEDPHWGHTCALILGLLPLLQHSASTYLPRPPLHRRTPMAIIRVILKGSVKNAPHDQCLRVRPGSGQEKVVLSLRCSRARLHSIEIRRKKLLPVTAASQCKCSACGNEGRIRYANQAEN
jgi:hypothetical protein